MSAKPPAQPDSARIEADLESCLSGPTNSPLENYMPSHRHQNRDTKAAGHEQLAGAYNHSDPKTAPFPSLRTPIWNGMWKPVFEIQRRMIKIIGE
jgi:hypothetical protein